MRRSPGYSGAVSNTEPAPDQVACGASRFTGVLHPRDVPLGGPRAIRVRRTLPQRERSLIGAWCFVDHYGPHDVGAGPGMDVPPHPHTGLQTVSWLFSGEIEHRDSAGVHAMVRPGELNLMTAGAGICHSEVSIRRAPILHGVQLWVALPDADRDTGRDFVHYAPDVQTVGGARIRVFLGELGRRPLAGAHLHAAAGSAGRPGPGRRGHLRRRPRPSNTACCSTRAASRPAAPRSASADLWYQSPGHDALVLTNRGEQPGARAAPRRAPFTEELVMWWNFVGRSHDDIVRYRRQWEEADERFGSVVRLSRAPACPRHRLPNSDPAPPPQPHPLTRGAP